MTGPKMHVDEREIHGSLVRELISSQFPRWAALPVERVASTGTDNAMYRIGDEMVARLPRTVAASWQVDKEHTWLPRLAEASLPLAIPFLLGQGVPSLGYPWSWSVYRWLDGEDATTTPVTDLGDAAIRLGRFVAALQRVDASGGPPPGDHNFWRGDDLAGRDADVRAALTELDGVIDTLAAAAAWDASLAAPPWRDAPVWVHGDLYAGNLLVLGGHLSGVIDFGALGVGDPACDVMAAWSYLSAETRDAFRAELPVDDATWERGRGWALSMALIGLPYYRVSNPVWAQIARHTIADVIADRA